jgi:hypothetical protein
MNCDRAVKDIALFLYGELSFEEEEALQQHLDGCSHCRDEVKARKALIAALDEFEPDIPMGLIGDCRRELRLRLRQEAALPRQSRAKRWFQGFREGLGFRGAWVRPLGAVALVALGFFGARLTSITRPGHATAEPLYSRVRTIEPDAAGRVQLVIEETRQRVLSGSLEDERIKSLLISAARDQQDPGIRVDSIDVLKQYVEFADVREALLAALEHDPNPGVRLKAIEGLKSFADDTETRKVLASVLLGDDNPGVRAQAIDLLVQKKEPEVVGLLQELVRHEDNNYVRLRSQRALREMNASVETF